MPPKPAQLEDASARGPAVDDFVRQYTEHFAAPQPSGQLKGTNKCVLITGATGSLGSHLVQYFAESADVTTVVCLNRASRGSVPDARQREALQTRGIQLSSIASAKLTALETDTSRENLGLESKEYEFLLDNVTHIVHNAWPMSGKRPLKGFESQFRVLRNLLDLSTAIASRHDTGFQFSFQFISSIAVVGHYPLWSGDVNVPEDRMTIDSVLPNGYGDAKLVCEKMIEATLEACPDSFSAMSVRLGQVAGSKTTGYWNPLEHLSFLIKSSQTLRALPDFDGVLSWTPVNDVASTLGELLLGPQKPHPIYHIDNPVRQPWREMTPVLAEALDLPIKTGIIPFRDWVRRVRNFPGSVENDNPAFKLIDFLDDNFVRMSCGGLLLGTEKTREHSKTLAELGPVGDEVARGYVRYWKEVGFLR